MKDKDKSLDVNEIFYSIDGEGIRAGQLAVFIRLNGCNERCSYCDTSYALKFANNMMGICEILDEVSVYSCKNVTLTGGEPLYQENSLGLVKALSDYEVNIETNGSLDVGDFILDNTIITMDIKTPSSNMESLNLYENIKKLRGRDVLKFVVGSKEDMDFTYKIIDAYKPACHIYLSPVFGQIDPANIVEKMKEYKDDQVKLQLQMHKFIWNPDQRGV
ncbi:MAG: radical SAM protein [Finegoldia sp.]|nr:radical SAM protein [Finegoldia sp.]